MTIRGFVVPPRSRIDLRTLANKLRTFVQMEEETELDVPWLYDVLAQKMPGFDFAVVEDELLGESHHGLTLPDEGLVVIPDRVYEGAADGRGRDKFTMVHEIGHFLLHRRVALARPAPDAAVEAFRDSEWQASAFAGEFLMPVQLVRTCDNAWEVAAKFRVSTLAAQYQWDQYLKEKLIEE